MSQWFKFYGQDYLTDPKMMALTLAEKAIWITLLCLASAQDEGGVVSYLNEERLKGLAGMIPTDDDWDNTTGILDKFVTLRLVTIVTDESDASNKTVTLRNFEKRQQQKFSGAERQKKYRQNHKSEAKETVTPFRNDSNARIEENRIEENNTPSIVPPFTKFSSLKKLTEDDFELIAEDYKVPVAFVRSCYDNLVNYCESTGRKYKNYMAALRNFVKKDAIQRMDQAKNQKGGVLDATNI